MVSPLGALEVERRLEVGSVGGVWSGAEGKWRTHGEAGGESGQTGGLCGQDGVVGVTSTRGSHGSGA